MPYKLWIRTIKENENFKCAHCKCELTAWNTCVVRVKTDKTYCSLKCVDTSESFDETVVLRAD